MDQLSESWVEKQFALCKFGGDLLDAVANLPENYSELYSIHPSVAFYSGKTALALNVAALPESVAASAARYQSTVDKETFAHTSVERTAEEAGTIQMHVIQFHQLMSSNEWDDEEGEQLSASKSSSPPASMEVLRVNWRTIMNHLFPSISVWGTQAVENTEYPLDKTSWRELRGRGTILLDRILMSYSVVVQFFGWRVHREETGELDRHRGWRERYEELAQHTNAKGGTSTTLEYETTNFYLEITRLVRVLQELRMNIYAVNLVKYVVEEMSKGRLRFLQPLAEKFWVPQIEKDDETPPERKRALRNKFDRIGKSDSD